MYRTVIIQIEHWKIHCAPFLAYKTDLVFFKTLIEFCNETQSCASSMPGHGILWTVVAKLDLFKIWCEISTQRFTHCLPQDS